MSFESFEKWCREKANEAKCTLKAIRHNEEIGRYEALFSEGTTIYANPTSYSISVRFGACRQHCATKNIRKEVAAYA